MTVSEPTYPHASSSARHERDNGNDALARPTVGGARLNEIPLASTRRWRRSLEPLCETSCAAQRRPRKRVTPAVLLLRHEASHTDLRRTRGTSPPLRVLAFSIVALFPITSSPAQPAKPTTYPQLIATRYAAGAALPA